MTHERLFRPRMNGETPEISPDALKDQLRAVTIVDVRRPDEFDGELSHIPGARLATLGPDLDRFLADNDKSAEIVFVCRSGARSARATLQGLEAGFAKAVNLQGGMMLWNELKLPVAGRP